MCGIAGFLEQGGLDREADECIARMTRALAHRGPDREGVWTDALAGIALGHRRLSVVDLSPAGDQPMLSRTGRYVIVFNGEIYNFPKLRNELENAGEPGFRGHSDTEVMLACFERYGVPGSLPRFIGMFAFAVWDRQERNLYLARDPLGEKPLYYGWSGDSFLFGSELKALRAHPWFRAEVDRRGLAMLLKDGYISAPHSIYREVFKLTPGCLLTLRSDSRDTEVRPYWSFRTLLERVQPFQGSEREAMLQLDRLLAEAVRMRTVADVPLGAFLSGGIDSSLVVGLMQAQSSRPVKTFTIGFHEAGYDEAAAAREVAQHLGTDHTECYVTSREALEVIPNLPALYDEPLADSSQIPTYLVAAMARKHVTVSLSGDGGDELFGGYSRYARMLRIRPVLRLLPGAVRGALNFAAGRVPDEGWRGLQKFAALAKEKDLLGQYLVFVRHWHGSTSMVRDAPPFPPLDRDYARRQAPLHQFMAADTVSYLPGDILAKVDRATMGVGLESRIPLLDPGVIEFAWALPSQMKLRGKQTKWILRQVLDRYVPRKLVERPKSGFGIPVAEWLRGPLRPWAEELLDARRLRREGFFDPAPVRVRWREHLAADYDHSQVLWSVLIFQAWRAAEASAAQEAIVRAPAAATSSV